MKRTLIALAMATCLTPMAAQAEAFRIIVTSKETPLVPNSVLHLAKSEGYFERAGVDVELIPVEQTPMAITALNTRGGDMANISVDGLMSLFIGGISNLKAIGSTDKAIPYIIASQNDLTLETLTGKKFGVGKAQSLDHTLSWTVLQTTQLVPETMMTVPLGQPPVRAQALASGKVDATTMSIGVYAAMPNKDNLKILVDAPTYFAAAPIVSKVNVVSQTVIDEKSKDLEAVLTALTLAARDYATTPEKWVEAMGRARPDVSKETLTELAQAYQKNWSVNGGIQKQELDYTHDWLYRTEKYQTGVAP
jgi:NitT/TauT family transport system substrate-binding protein